MCRPTRSFQGDAMVLAGSAMTTIYLFQLPSKVVLGGPDLTWSISCKKVSVWTLPGNFKNSFSIYLFTKQVHTTARKQTALNRSQTNCNSLNYDLDLQSPLSHGHDLLTCKRSRSKVIQLKIENIQTDRWTEATALPNSLMRSVIKWQQNWTTRHYSALTVAHIKIIKWS